MIIVKYIETNEIEGYVKDEESFRSWLKEHNLKRKEIGELIENEHEFELIEIKELKKEVKEK